MNCKPGQMAWIDIPRTRANVALGLDQLQGHIVQTKALHPAFPVGQPIWTVEPPQSVRIPATCSSIGGLRAGDVLHCWGIPDAFLRPIEDFPPEELVDLQRELVS